MAKTFGVALPTEVTPETPKYDHGYSAEQVEEIKARFKELSRRDLRVTPVTKKEFAEIVVPHCRIGRTEVLSLQKEKPVKVPKPPKEPKVKPLTKKAIKEKITLIAIKSVTGELTEEEQAFLSEHTGNIL